MRLWTPRFNEKISCIYKFIFYIYLCFHLFIYLGLHTVLENISALWWEETGDRGETFSNTSLLHVYERKENLTLYREVLSVIFWGIRIYMHKKVFVLSVLVQKTSKKWSALYRGELQYFCWLITQGPCSLFQARQAYLGPALVKNGLCAQGRCMASIHRRQLYYAC